MPPLFSRAIAVLKHQGRTELPGNSCRIGICGLGKRVAHLVGFLRRTEPGFEVVAYTDPIKDSQGVAYLRSINVAPGVFFPGLEELLSESSIDLLLIGSPNVFHVEQIECGLRAGVKIFAEKPLATDEAQTFRLIELLRIHGGDRLIAGLVLRYAPMYRDLLRFVESGALGVISSIEASEHLPPEHGAFLMRDWRRYESLTGGYLLEKCVHDLDLYRSIVGARPARVCSFGGRRTFVPSQEHLETSSPYHSWPVGWNGGGRAFSSDGDIVDHQMALVEYENGACLCFHSNLHVPNKSRRFHLTGSLAGVEGDFERNYLRIYEAKSGECIADKSYVFNAEHGHYGSEELMARDISAHIFQGRPLPVSAVDALEAGLTAIKIDQARKSGGVISLAETWSKFDALTGVEGEYP